VFLPLFSSIPSPINPSLSFSTYTPAQEQHFTAPHILTIITTDIPTLSLIKDHLLQDKTR
jgi:hypothetical protein